MTTLELEILDLFLKTCFKEIARGNCIFVNRNYIINGKNTSSKQALIDIGIMNKKEVWSYIMELKPSDFIKMDWDYNKSRDTNSEIFVFKKEINNKIVYIKLTINNKGVVCISFHESY